MVTLDDVRALTAGLPRSYEALVRDRVKFRVGRIVYLAFSRDETLMGFAFPKEEPSTATATRPATPPGRRPPPATPNTPTPSTSTYQRSGGVDRRNDLGGLNLSTVPKVLIETANMQNPTDAALLEDPPFRQRVAEGIAAGIEAFLAA